MKHCSNCQKHTIKQGKGFCKLKNFYVSISANWCKSFKKKGLIHKIKTLFSYGTQVRLVHK